MSNQIESRVVEMRFDNKHFESNVKTTMSSLDKLKESLRFKDSTKGLENIDKASKKVNLTHMGKAVDTVQAKFSALEVMGVTALANITNSAVNAGKRIASALTIDPIKTGFQEYETQMNAVQTILANTSSKGTTLKQVNEALDELNTYADKTIYNFTEMTRNIGTFTAAGVDLETSVTAIQGIANLAAVSGSNSQQASTAMYQLSQALATGTVKLMDWNSVVNAGMGGQVFQDALKETARAHGIAVDEMIENNGSFRESLQEGWITSEVLTETLQKFTMTTEGLTEAEIKQNREMLRAKGYTEDQIDAIFELGKTATDAATKVKTFTQMWEVIKESVQSGWAQTWKLIFGDFEQAKSLFTPLTNFFTNIISNISEARNKLIGGAMGKSFKGLVEGINSVTKPVKAAVEAIEDYGAVVDRIMNGEFGNGQARFEALTKAGYDWAHAQNLVNEKLGSTVRHATKYSEAQAETEEVQTELNETNAEYIEQLTEMSDAELKNIGYTEEQITAIRQLAEEADKLGLSVMDFVEQIDELDGRTILINSFKNAGQGLVAVITAIKDAWTNTFPPATSEQLYNVIAALHKFSTHLVVSDETADKLRRTFEGLFAIIDIILTVVGGPIKIAFKAFTQLLGMADLNILDFTAAIGDAIVKFRDFVDSSLDFTRIFEKMMPYISDAAKGIREWFKSLNLANMSPADILSGLITGLSNGIAFVIDTITILISSIPDKIKGIKKHTDDIPKDIISGLVKGLKNGISVVAEAVIELGKTILETIKNVLGIHSPSTEFIEIGKNIIDGFLKGLQNGFDKVMGFFRNLGSKCVEIIKSIDFGKIFSIAAGAGMIMITKNVTDIIKSFAGLGESLLAPLEGLGDFLSGLGKSIAANRWKKMGGALLDLAKAIAILVASLYVLSKIENLEDAMLALVNLSIIIGVLGFAASKIKFDDFSAVKLTVALVGISLALTILASALKKLSFINGDNAGSIILGVGILVAGLCTLFATLGKTIKGKTAANIDKVGGMIVKMSIALLLLTKVLQMISKLEAGALVKGIVCIGLFVLFVQKLSDITQSTNKGVDKLGSTLLRISGAILILVVTIKLISKLTVDELVKGAICIAAFALFVKALVNIVRTNSPGEIQKLGGLLFGVSSAIMILALTIKLIGELTLWELTKGIVVVGLLGIFITALVKCVQTNGASLKGIGITLLLLSVAIGILAGVTVVLGMIDPVNLLKGVVAVGFLMTFMSTLVKATANARGCKGDLIVLTVAIGVMAAAVAALSFIDPAKLAGATIAIGTLMGMFALMIKVTTTAEKVMGKLIVMTIIVGALAGIIYLLSSVEPERALAAAGSISMLLGTLAVTMGLCAIVGKFAGKAAAGIGSLLLMCIPLAALVAILYAMQGIENAATNATVLTVFAAAMSVLLLALTGIGAIIGATAGVGLLGIVGLLAMCVPLIALVGVLHAMQGIENARSNAEVLITLTAALTVLCLALIPVGLLAGPVALGILALTGAIGLFGGLIVAVGALVDEFPVLEVFIDKGLIIFEKLATGLGKIISAFVTSATSGIPAMGQMLSDFMTNVQPFIDGVQSIDSSMLTGVETLVKAILQLISAGFIDDITIGSFADLGEELSEFMMNASGFIAGAAKISPQVVVGITALVAALKVIQGGDKKAIKQFCKNIKKLGETIPDFVRSVGKFDESKIATIRNIATAIKILTSVVKSVPENVSDTSKSLIKSVKSLIKGFKQIIKKIDDIKETDIQGVQYKIKNIGECISLFQDINIPSESNSEQSKLLMDDMKKFVKEFKSIIKHFWSIKETDIDGVSYKLKNILAAISCFGDVNVGNTDITSLSALMEGIVSFVKNFKKVKKTIQFIKETDIDGVSYKLKNILSAISGFGDINVGNTDITSLSALMEGIVPFVKNFKKVKKTVQFIKETDIDGVNYKLRNILTAISSFAHVNIDNTDVSSLVTLMEGIVSCVGSFKKIKKKIQSIKETDIDGVRYKLENITKVLTVFDNFNVTTDPEALKNLTNATVIVINDFKDIIDKCKRLKESDLEGVKAKLKDIIQALTVYNNVNTNIDIKAIENIVSGTKNIVGDFKSLMTKFWEIKETDIAGVKTKLGKILDVISGLASVAVPQTDTDTLKNLVADVSTIVVDFKTIIGNICKIKETDVEGVKAKLGKILDVISSLSNILIPTFDIEILKTLVAGLPIVVSDFKDIIGNICKIEETDIEGVKAKLGKILSVFTLFSNLTDAAYLSFDIESLKTLTAGIANVFSSFKSIIDNAKWLDNSGGDFEGVKYKLDKILSSINVLNNYTLPTIDIDGLQTLVAGLPTVISDFKSVISNICMIKETDVEGVKAKLNAIISAISGLNTLVVPSIDVKSLQTLVAGLPAVVTDFKTLISNICTVEESDIAGVKTKLSKMVEAINNIGTVDTISLDSLKTSLESAAKDLVKAFSDAFSAETAATTAKTAIDGFITKAATNTKSQTHYDEFKGTGKYMVEGFAAGIKLNTYIATQAASDMAGAAKTAADAKLNVNSPSKEMMKTGSSVVEGFAKGINDNLGDVKDSAVTLGSTMLKATQSYLKINSPSIVFEKEVGRWIVKGIAEGVKKDMSAEEAAEKKAQNIVSAFKKALDNLDLDTEISEKKFNLWATSPEGKKATAAEIDSKELASLQEQLAKKKEYEKLASDELAETKKYFEKKQVDEKAVKEAESKYLDAQQARQDIEAEILEVQNRNLYTEEQQLEDSIAIRNGLYDKWESGLGKDASVADKNKRKIKVLQANLNDYIAKAKLANDAYNEAIRVYGAQSAEANEAYQKVLEAETTVNNTVGEIETLTEDTAKSLVEIRKNKNDQKVSISDSLYDIWENTLGIDAKDSEKNSKKSKTLMSNLSTELDTYATLKKDYYRLFAEDPESDETRAAFEAWISQAQSISSLYKELDTIFDDMDERNKKMTERQELAFGDYNDYIDKYKTYYLKNGMSMEDLYNDAKLVTGYDPDFKPDPSVDKQRENVKKLLDGSGFWNDVESNFTNKGKNLGTAIVKAINESIIQLPNITGNGKVALNDFGGAIVQMTADGITVSYPTLRDSLSSTIAKLPNITGDAKVVVEGIGFSIVDGIIVGIQKATPNLVNACHSLTSSVTNTLETDWDINSPSKVCAELGRYLTAGLSKGLVDGIHDTNIAASAVSDSVINNLRKSIARVSEIVSSDLDAEPTIKPILDLSDVNAGTARLNSMFSRTQALHISSAMAGRESGEVQNGNTTTNNTYQYTQNNYSPKALSTTEIYRQTKNQFTAMKRGVNNK